MSDELAARLEGLRSQAEQREDALLVGLVQLLEDILKDGEREAAKAKIEAKVEEVTVGLGKIEEAVEVEEEPIPEKPSEEPPAPPKAPTRYIHPVGSPLVLDEEDD